MSETKYCPKCGTAMTPEDIVSYGSVRLLKGGDWRGDKIIPFYCRHCGYIELYNEKNLNK